MSFVGLEQRRGEVQSPPSASFVVLQKGHIMTFILTITSAYYISFGIFINVRDCRRLAEN